MSYIEGYMDGQKAADKSNERLDRERDDYLAALRAIAEYDSIEGRMAMRAIEGKPIWG